MSEFRLYISVLNGLRLRFTGGKYRKVLLEIKNPWTGDYYHRILKKGKQVWINIHYLTNWEIKVYGIIETEHRKGKRIFYKKLAETKVSYEGLDIGFKFATEALGDTLCWVPIIEEWAKRNKPKAVYLWTKWNHLFDKSQYPSNFVWLDEPEEFKVIPNLVFSVVGISRNCETLHDTKRNHATPINWKDCNLVDTQNYSFGLPLHERKPKLINPPDQRPLPEPYITLCPGASQKIKHWLNPQGWMQLVRACHSMGLKVVTVGNTPNILPEVMNGNGENIQQAMYLIKHAEFHIGLSSGLSWMAWAFNKPVLMVGDFTHPGYEFQDNVVRMYTDSEQAGVFNRLDIPWEPVYDYDPFNDNLQIARVLRPDHALLCLKVLVDKLRQGSFKGVYVLPDGSIKEISKLHPRRKPLTYK